ncbi:MAG: proton-conducting transporter membrane subunit [Firmicutes bacterium]|nr:proton-conducting transporter membrane subunit [Bacillota bacterium]
MRVLAEVWPALIPAVAGAFQWRGWPARWSVWVWVEVLAGWAVLLVSALGGFHPPGPLATWYFWPAEALGGLALAVSLPYIRREAEREGWSPSRVRGYFALFSLFWATVLGMALVPNYLALWADVEGSTVASVLLVAVHGYRRSVEAAWKYLLVAGSGGLVALAGLILTLHGLGLPLGAWSLHPRPVAPVRGGEAALGLVLAVVGFGTKAGLAPFHTWLPDAHSEAPAPVSALLSGVELAGAALVLLRLLRLAPAPAAGLAHGLLVGMGLLSLAVAAGAMGFQTDLKRLWAYSSIEHMGLIALGFGFGGVALVGALLHIWTHAVTKTLLFYDAGQVRLAYGGSTLGRARGVLRQLPWTGGLLGLGAAAIVGLPPFAPFWSEWLILAGGFSRSPWAAGIALALLMGAFIAIGRRVPVWLFGGRTAVWEGERWALVVPMLVLAAAVTGGGVGFAAALQHTVLATRTAWVP